jgi:4-carboxymuconolactone decarboxylase
MSWRSGAGDIESKIVAREADVVGKPQRFESLTMETMSDDAKAFLNEMMSRYPAPADGKPRPIPTTFAVMLRHPELCRQQTNITGFYNARSELSLREREIAILSVAWHCGSPFVFGEHVGLAKQGGLTPEEIERLTQGSAASGWSAHERAIIKGVEEMMSNHLVSDETWGELSKTWSDKQLLEFPGVVGQFFCSCLQQNSVRTRLSSHNVGLRQR